MRRAMSELSPPWEQSGHGADLERSEFLNCQEIGGPFLRRSRSNATIRYGDVGNLKASMMRRREFVRLVGGAALAWPFPGRAQQTHQLRRIGFLSSFTDTDLEAQSQVFAFRKRLDELGWADGGNIHIDYRWSAGSTDRMQIFATELVRSNPDVLVAISTPATGALQHETHTIPIVFAFVSDPVGAGFVVSLANPGGNITGFIDIEASLSGKWLNLMGEITPHVSRVGFLFNPKTAPFARYYLDTFRSSASALAVEAIEAPVQNTEDIQAVMTKLGREADAGLVVMPDTSMVVYRETIVSIANRYRMPVIYPFRFFATDGGLLSYGIDLTDLYRSAASYVDRILRGAKPSELPVQLPTKFELVINLRTAKALGLKISDKFLTIADEVIE
jgi:putative ABC transport system substrate-binding protein